MYKEFLEINEVTETPRENCQENRKKMQAFNKYI